MSKYEDRVREAFIEVHVPAQVSQSTLDFIEAQRLDVESQISSNAPVVTSVVSPTPVARRAPHRHLAARILATAACLILAVVIAGGAKIYFEPTAFIDIDVNPSIELAVNRFDRVIEATAFNEDGQNVLNAVDVRHKDAQTAIEIITTSEASEPYVRADSYVSISVVSEDERQSASLTSQGQQVVDGLSCSGSCQSIDAETREKAQQAHMGVGKFLATQQLLELDDSVTLEECSEMTMRELRDHIAEQGGELSVSGECKNGAGHGQQQGRHQHLHGEGSGKGQM